MCKYPHNTLIAKYARPRTVDAPLTLIFGLWKSACCCYFHFYRLPLSHEWMSATNQNRNYPWCTAIDWRHCVDGHSQNGAVPVLVYLLPIHGANTSVTHNSDQITVQLPYLQNRKSLTLRWRSLEYIAHSSSAAFKNSFNYDLNLLVVFLTDCDSTLWQSQMQ